MEGPPTDAEIQARNVRAVAIFGLTFVISAGVTLSRHLRGEDVGPWIAISLVFMAIFAATIYRWLNERSAP